MMGDAFKPKVTGIPPDGCWESEKLAAACGRLGIPSDEVAEAALHRMDTGAEEPRAVRESLVEYLRRRGLYHGHLRRLVDDGTIFRFEERTTRNADS